jgi:L-amino acid N-acyltransferase YncA
MLKKFLRTAYSAFMLLKMVGPKLFLKKLGRQLYSRDVQIGLEKNLEEDSTLPPANTNIKYYLRTATEADMDEAFQQTDTESKESVQILMYMKWLYECGFRNWYIARTADTNEVCFMDSVILPEDNPLIEKSFKTWFPILKDDEVLLEGAYAFEKFRGKGLTTCAHVEMLDIFRKKGFKRMLVYIKKDNLPSFKLIGKVGFTKFEEVPVLKILFFTRRKFRQFN